MKIRETRLVAVFAALLVLAASQSAWAYHYDRKGTFVIGGGFNNPVGGSHQYFNTGGSLFIAGGRHLNDKNTIQLEWLYNWVSISQAVVDKAQSESLQVDDAYGDNWSLTLNWVRRLNTTKDIVPWITGGFGIYLRTIEITQTLLVYYPPIWDPWWGWIGGGWAPGEVVTGQREDSGAGFNVGGGIDFAIENGASLFIDVRYHYSNLSGLAIEQVPVTFGVRW
jgi:opacity protein-like surface antigen